MNAVSRRQFLFGAAAVVAATPPAAAQEGIASKARGNVFNLSNIIDVTDPAYGAKGNGSTDDATAFVNAIAAASGKTLYIPDPPGGSHYKIGSTLGTIPAGTRLQGQNKAATKLQRAFTGGQLMTLADSVSLDNLWIEGDGAKFSGKGITIGGTDGKQNVTNCRIVNFNGNCIEFTATTAGSQSNFDNLETWQTSGTTGSGKYAIVNADATQARAVPKCFVHVETAGMCSFSFGGANDVFVIGSFIGDIAFSANTKSVHVVGTRLANQRALSILGDNHTFTGCTIAPNVTLAGTGPYALQGNTYNGAVTDSSSNNNNVVDVPSYSYSTSWTGSVSNPAIGNGSLRAEATRHGDTMTIAVDLTIGSTTTFGSGSWRFSVPVRATPLSGATQLGTAFLSDSSAATTEFGWARIVSGNAYMEIQIRGVTSIVTPAAPWKWASGDVIRINMTYQL